MELMLSDRDFLESSMPTQKGQVFDEDIVLVWLDARHRLLTVNHNPLVAKPCQEERNSGTTYMNRTNRIQWDAAPAPFDGGLA